jgi:hypothetical protein
MTNIPFSELLFFDGFTMNLCRRVGKTSKLPLIFSQYILNPVSRFLVRDFVFSEDELIKQREELEMAKTTEKELWV